MWVARDKNGSLKLVDIKPYRKEKLGEWFIGHEFEGDYMYIDRDLFPNLKWEDEPIEVFLFDSSLFENVSKLITEYNDNCHPNTDYIKTRLIEK